MRLAYAHADQPPAPHDVLTAWTLDPYVIVPIGLAVFLYTRGLHRSWQRAGRGRGVRRWEAACFAAGMLLLGLALVWPFDALGEALFSAHMAQHLLLMNLAAPLMVLGAPLQVMIRALPRRWQRPLAALARARAWRAGWRQASGAPGAALLQQIALWAWHAPAAIAVSLHNDFVHALMHATLLAAGLLFWTAVLVPRERSFWAPLGALLVTLKVSGLVCIMLLIRPGVLYPAYGGSALAWGLTPEQDEQIGWGLMMTLGSFTYFAAAVALFALAFSRLERRAA